MKYKYVGIVPAVLLVNDELASIAPGEEVDIQVVPSSHFISIPSPTPRRSTKKEKPKSKQDINNATYT